jgi:hypothetical protein
MHSAIKNFMKNEELVCAVEKIIKHKEFLYQPLKSIEKGEEETIFNFPFSQIDPVPKVDERIFNLE